MANFWDYLGIGSSEADAAHETAAQAMEANSRALRGVSRSLGADTGYFESLARKDERQQAVEDAEALAAAQEKRVKRSLALTGNRAAAQAAAAKAAAETRDNAYAGALQQNRARKDAAKEKAAGLKREQARMSAEAAAAQGQAAKERSEKMTAGQRANALTDRMLQLGMTAASLYGAGENAGWWGKDAEAEGGA
jgi:hypothetical protein